jgi:hypothetical protein
MLLSVSTFVLPSSDYALETSQQTALLLLEFQRRVQEIKLDSVFSWPLLQGSLQASSYRKSEPVVPLWGADANTSNTCVSHCATLGIRLLWNISSEQG